MNRRAFWRWARRVLAAAFFVAVAVLLVSQARDIEWSEVGQALRGTDPLKLAIALALTALSYAIYAGYDLLARRYTGHRMPRRRVAAVAMVSYAFNLNMGALIGGAGFRFRLYSRLGLKPATIARVLGFSVATNWGGYVLLGGIALTLQWLPRPLQSGIGSDVLFYIGILLLLAAAAYPALCKWSPRRRWCVRGHELHLPSWRTALLQLAVSTANWLTIATIVFLLMPEGVAYRTTLTVLLAAAVAGAITHVPAGVGVLEAVFVMAFGARFGTPAVLAALLTYRGLYYLVPLLIALVGYLLLERVGSTREDAAGAHPERH